MKGFVFKLAQDFGEINPYALARSIAYPLLLEWAAYYDMTNYIDSQMAKGKSYKEAMEMYRTIQEIRERRRAKTNNV